MEYTVWNGGKLLGTSSLEYARVFEKHRMGSFMPTPEGERLLPLLTGVSSSVMTLSKALRASELANERPLSLNQIHAMTEYADYASAMDEREYVKLELRGPDGSLIPTEWIEIRDCEALIRFAEEGDEQDQGPFGAKTVTDDESVTRMSSTDAQGGYEELPAIQDTEEFSGELADTEHDGAPLFENDEPWKEAETVEFPRYQVQVMLEEEWSVP